MGGKIHIYSYQRNKRNCFYNKQNHACCKTLSELLLEAIKTMLFDDKKKMYWKKVLFFYFEFLGMFFVIKNQIVMFCILFQ